MLTFACCILFSLRSRTVHRLEGKHVSTLTCLQFLRLSDKDNGLKPGQHLLYSLSKTLLALQLHKYKIQL